MIHLFVGPTLSAKAVSELLPEAHVCPPVKHGDLLRLDPRPGDVVAIVDGLVRQEIAIRHKEILDVLERGLQVCGASGMGALRAAELRPYGMLGIGEVFDMLMRGEIEGDDEVLVAHADAEDGYRASTEALVDIRLHCRQAVEADVVDEQAAAAIVAAAGALAYDERSYARVLADATEHGLTPAASAAYLGFVRRDGRSVRIDDALMLVRHLQHAAATAPGAEIELADTPWIHGWRHALKGWRNGSGSFVADRVVLNFIRIAARDYPAFYERVVLEQLGAFYGEQLDLSVPDAGELIENFRSDHDVESEHGWDAWCVEHEIREEELTASLVRKARLRAVTQTSDASLDRLRQLAAEYAVALGLWPEDEVPDAQVALWLTARERRRLSRVEQAARVAVRSFQVHPGIASDGTFVEELKLSGTFARARAILMARAPLAQAQPRAGDVVNWCAMRWGVDAIGPFEILDRGLDSPARYAQGEALTAALVTRASRFYARAQASGDFPELSVAAET